MLDSQEIINSIDKRLAQARKEIASLESALKAMSKKPKTTSRAAAAQKARSGGAARPSCRRL